MNITIINLQKIRISEKVLIGNIKFQHLAHNIFSHIFLKGRIIFLLFLLTKSSIYSNKEKKTTNALISIGNLLVKITPSVT